MRNRTCITIAHYKEKHNVLLLSSRHLLEMCQMKKKTKTQNQTPYFFTIKKKKGVDIADQIAIYEDVLQKSLKWYRKVAFDTLLNMAVTNSWIIYPRSY